jgi:predicted ArsR family transcriptional regulator
VTDAADSVEPTALRAVAALSEDQRRRLYRFARTERRPVSREEAAAAVGISRKLAAFHLDKLVQAGLLRHRFRAVDGGRVGRRPKVYEPTEASFEVSIPPRRHEVLADILVEAVLTESEYGSARTAANSAAYQRGFAAGTDLRGQGRPGRLGTKRALDVLQNMLADSGFEPDLATPRCLRLRNCPFHPLAQKAPELVCGLNHALIRGLIDGLQAGAVEAVLTPTAGQCCVEIRTAE